MTDLSKKTLEKEQRIKQAKMRKFLKIYMKVLLAYTVVAILVRMEFFLYISAALFVVNTAIVILFPRNFSIRGTHKKEKRNEFFVAGFLVIPLISSIALFWARANNVSHHFFMPTLIVGAVVGTVMIVCFREEWKTVKSSAIGVYVISFLIALGMVATVAFPTAHRNLTSSETAEVMETDRRRTGGRHKSTYYVCTVRLSDGTEREYDITHSLYEELKNGDTVRIETYEGVFGITFTYVNH